MKSILPSLLVAVLYAAPSVPAAEKGPEGGQNAALRYWMAFALMSNPTADTEVARRIANVAEGLEPWDDALAPILDLNAEALATMHRGSKAGFCDWGFEHEMLGAAPIANLPRARALARLNVLSGMRLLDEGRSVEAVEVWLAGIRFSRDVAADGPWLSALVAGGALRVHLNAVARAARDGKLDGPLREKLRREIAALDETGFDWSLAARHESETLSAILLTVENAPDPLAALKNELGTKTGAPVHDRGSLLASLRRARELNDRLRPELLTVFRTPYARAVPEARELDGRAEADPTLAAVWPSVVRANAARGEVIEAREALLAALR